MVTIAIFMLCVMPSVYAHTQDYLKGYKLGKQDGKTGAGGYGSVVCTVSMSNKSRLSHGIRIQYSILDRLYRWYEFCGPSY
jgi:hypothetical protein